jgi:hypothetical protein
MWFGCSVVVEPLHTRTTSGVTAFILSQHSDTALRDVLTVHAVRIAVENDSWSSTDLWSACLHGPCEIEERNQLSILWDSNHDAVSETAIARGRSATVLNGKDGIPLYSRTIGIWSCCLWLPARDVGQPATVLFTDRWRSDTRGELLSQVDDSAQPNVVSSGVQSGQRFGWHMVKCGDVDGDQVEDWAISSYPEIVGGWVDVLSGRDKHMIMRLECPKNGDEYTGIGCRMWWFASVPKTLFVVRKCPQWSGGGPTHGQGVVQYSLETGELRSQWSLCKDGSIEYFLPAR